MKPYPHPSHRLNELVNAEKCPQEGSSLDFGPRGSKGKSLDLRLDLLDGPFVDLRFFVHTHNPADVTSYESGLCIDGPRIRGIGYSPIQRLKKYKVYIPKGWHENVCNPNLSGDDANRHDPLPDFQVTDLRDFTRKSADRWKIRLDYGEELV